MDLHVPGALPTMVCRPPTLNGTPVRVRNRAKVLAMPGVTHVAKVSHRRRRARGRPSVQCIDAIRALDVDVEATARWPASRTLTSWPSCAAAELPLRTQAAAPARRRPSRPSSSSTSAATPPWSPTARSPTCAPTRPTIWALAQVADHRAGADRHAARPDRRQGHRPRHPGRRVVRPQAVLRRRPRGGRDLARRWASRSS